MCIMYKSNNCTLCNVYDQCQFGHKLVESKFNETWNVSKQVEVGQHLTQHWPNGYPFLVSMFINFHHLCIFVLEWFGHFKIKVLHLALFMIHHASLTWSLFVEGFPVLNYHNTRLRSAEFSWRLEGPTTFDAKSLEMLPGEISDGCGFSTLRQRKHEVLNEVGCVVIAAESVRNHRSTCSGNKPKLEISPLKRHL